MTVLECRKTKEVSGCAARQRASSCGGGRRDAGRLGASLELWGVVEQRDAGGLGANDDVSLPSSWCIW